MICYAKLLKLIYTSFNSFTSPFFESVKNPLAGGGTAAAVALLFAISSLENCFDVT